MCLFSECPREQQLRKPWLKKATTAAAITGIQLVRIKQARGATGRMSARYASVWSKSLPCVQNIFLRRLVYTIFPRQAILLLDVSPLEMLTIDPGRPSLLMV